MKYKTVKIRNYEAYTANSRISDFISIAKTHNLDVVELVRYTGLLTISIWPDWWWFSSFVVPFLSCLAIKPWLFNHITANMLPFYQFICCEREGDNFCGVINVLRMPMICSTFLASLFFCQLPWEENRPYMLSKFKCALVHIVSLYQYLKGLVLVAKCSV